MEQNTDKSPEIAQLRTQLSDIQKRIQEKIKEIDKIITKLKTEYRHRDREKYQTKYKEISRDLLQFETEMTQINDKIKELGG